MKRHLMLAVTAFLLAASAVPAQATHHRWFFAGQWVHQHTREFPVYQQLSTTTDALADASLAQWDLGTVLSLPSTSCHDCSRIHELEGNFGDTGWLGLASVEGSWDSGSGHYNHGHTSYNRFYAETEALMPAITCQEQGHILGLDHDFSVGAFSCMSTGYTIYIGMTAMPHDLDTLNFWYPATGH